MRTAETVLTIIRERGQQTRPLERVYRQLYNPNLYLHAYGKLQANKGAMTPGVTPETVDGMSLAKIDNIITALRQERYRWTPVRRTYIPKSSGQRPLGLPTWSDKLLQEAIRLILEAYYEPTFSDYAHGFRPGRGCHTALHQITQQWRGIKWFIELDIASCFNAIDHTVLVNILKQNIHDNRFIHLIETLLKAGYLEDWRYNQTYSGVPQGGVVSPILSNLVLDKLDKYIEQTLIPAYTRGHRRKTYAPYVALTKAAWQARQAGDREAAQKFAHQAQMLPSRDPNDPDFRRLRYVRYADDALLGFVGPKVEAQAIKQHLTDFLQSELKLELNQQKTLITHARTETARFLGYEIHTLQADDKHDYRGQRCINGGIGLRVPQQVITDHCRKYMKRGKPVHLPQRLRDEAYSIVAQYQTEYVGLVQYYRLAYNLHRFNKLKWVMQTSLTKTLARKFKTTRRRIYQRFRTDYQTSDGIYKVIEVQVDRGSDQPPLTARFGGVSLRWNNYAAINDTKTTPIWSGRSEVIDRLLAQECELCGATHNIEVHHIRKLTDLNHAGQPDKPLWMQEMAARRRKTLVVCQSCHHDIHYGRYDGPKLSN